MAKRKRTRVELYIDILIAIGRGRESPSRLVYAANLSYDRVMRCINFLELKNLVRKNDGDKKVYKLTEKGVEIIKHCRKSINDLTFQQGIFETRSLDMNAINKYFML